MHSTHSSVAYHLLQDIPRPIALNAVVPQLLACPGYGFVNVLLEVASEAAQSIEADAIPQVRMCSWHDVMSYCLTYICKCALSLLDDLGFATDFIRVTVRHERDLLFVCLTLSRYSRSAPELQLEERLLLFVPPLTPIEFWFVQCSWDAGSTSCIRSRRCSHLL